MLDVFNFANPQTANFQEFYGVLGSRTYTVKEWTKPRGVSMVRILLIGAGGAGYSNSTGGNGGGGSGAITQWIGPAIFIPDSLTIQLSNGAPQGNPGLTSNIIWQGPNNSSTGYTLLSANAGGSASGGGAGGTASSNNFFGASGIFTSIAGQAGAAIGAAITASTTTFLSGGAGGGSTTTSAGGNVATKYGYPSVSGGAAGVQGNSGYFITQPIMLGTGGGGGGGGTAGNGKAGGDGGYGCGGGGAGTNYVGVTGRGGPAACFIWSW